MFKNKIPIFFGDMTTEHDFSQILAASDRREKGLWAIGDALLLEVGPPAKGDLARFRAALAEIHEEGLGEQYEVRDLRAFRDTSYAFPPGSRRSCLWALHQAAGSPGFLDAILAGIPMKELTVKHMTELRKGWEKYGGNAE